MRIALFLPQLSVSGGLGVYCRSLLDGLLRTAPDVSIEVLAPSDPKRLFPNSGLDESWRPLAGDSRVRVHGVDWPADHPLALALDAVLGAAVEKLRPDLVHRSYYSGFRNPPCRQLITFHDAGFLESPATFGDTARQRREMFAAIAPRVCRLVCVSADARDRICKLLPFDRARADVVHLALSDPAEALAAARAPQRVHEPLWAGGESVAGWGDYLFVPVGAATGFNRVRKNVPTAVQAFRALHHPTTRLIIASTGVIHAKLLTELLPESERAAGRIAGEVWESGDGLVRVLPNLERGPFLTAMAHSRAVVYPTRFEGFGLPSVEAMALEVPLIAGRATSIPEVVGDAGILVDPDDVAGFVAAFRNILEPGSQLARELVARGRERVKQFTLERLGEEIMKVYRRAMEMPIPQ